MVSQAPFHAPDQYWWKRYGDIHDGLIPKLLGRLIALEGEGALIKAWDAFHTPLATDAPSFYFDRGSGYEHESQLVYPWAFYEWIPTSLERQQHPVALEYAASVSANRFEKTFIETACFTPLSFYEVIEVHRGLGLRMKDVFSGEMIDIGERSGSGTLQIGHLVYGRAVRLNGVTMLVGTSSIVLGPMDRLEVLKLKLQLESYPGRKKNADLNWPQILIDFAFLIRTLYLSLRERALHPPPVQIQNTDGDPMELHSMEFLLRSDVEDAAEKLRDLCTHDPENPFADCERNESGKVTRVHVKWSKLGNAKHKEWTNTTLGDIEITSNKIVASTNSKKRAKSLRKILEERLTHQISFVGDTVKTQDELRDVTLLDKARGRKKPQPQAVPPELAEIAKEMRRKHWIAWLDTKIPALGNRTPRSAVRSESGRAMVEALLQDFEMKGNKGPNEMAPDIKFLKQSLGL